MPAHSSTDPRSPLDPRFWTFLVVLRKFLRPASLPVHSHLSLAGIGGVCAQRVHSANYYVVYPGNTPANHPPYRSVHDPFKTASGRTIQDPGTRGKHQTKTKIPGVPAGAVGCRIQDPGTRGYRWWKTADFSHSAGTARAHAHGAPTITTTRMTTTGPSTLCAHPGLCKGHVVNLSAPESPINALHGHLRPAFTMWVGQPATRNIASEANNAGCRSLCTGLICKVLTRGVSVAPE